MKKVVKITKARVNLANHDYFVSYVFFCYFFACNEAHKSHKIQLKNEKLSKSRGVMHLLPYILKAENTKFDTFRVGH